MNKPKLIFICIMVMVIAAGMLICLTAKKTVTTTSDVGEISAGQAILIDGKTGEILYEKNADEKAYPASTTKIMTALLVIETLEEYDSPIQQIIKVPDKAVGVEGSSLYLSYGERISIEDLLYGLMLVSGNDAAVALAETIGGNQETFVEMMNEKARQLGCQRTNFVNPNGLFHEEHYTTVKDMALIARTAMSNDTFKQIASARGWKCKSRKGEYVTFANKNKTVHQYQGGNGVKIGYTENSGRTLVASAERNGRTMICVVMSAPDWFNDAYKLMDYGFGGEKNE